MITSPQKNMERHIKAIGIVYIAFGVLSFMTAALVLILHGGLTGLYLRFPSELVGLIVTTSTVAHLLLAIPSVVLGLGLLRRTSWARSGTIVLCVLSLPNAPFGSLIAMYALWVVLAPRADRVFVRPYYVNGSGQRLGI